MIEPEVFLLLFSLLFLAIVLLLTLKFSSLVIPRYQTNISQIPEDTPGHLGGDLTGDSSTAADGSIADANLDAIDLPHLGGSEREGLPEQVEEEITALYLISYAQRIYLNQLFWLRVEIDTKEIPLSSDPGRQEAARGSLRFTHRWFPEFSGEESPRPDLQVELKYSEDEFRVMNPVQVKPLPAAEKAVFDFAVKPLKSEDSALLVNIAYVGSKRQPRQVSMIELTEENGNESTTTKATPPSIVEENVVLASEELTIATRSFLNMNAASLNIFSKATAVILTIIYIGAVIGFEFTDDRTATVIVGLSSVVSALGIPVAGDVWKNAQVRQEKAAAG